MCDSTCENQEYGETCEDIYNCCNCGVEDTEFVCCNYCFSCNACYTCLNGEEQ